MSNNLGADEAGIWCALGLESGQEIMFFIPVSFQNGSCVSLSEKAFPMRRPPVYEYIIDCGAFLDCLRLHLWMAGKNG